VSHNALRQTLKTILFLAAGLLTWWFVLPLLTAPLLKVANLVLSWCGVDAQLAQLTPTTAQILSSRAANGNGGTVRVDYLTFNVVALLGLFSFDRVPLLRTLRRLALAFAALLFIYVGAIIAVTRGTLVQTLVARGVDVSQTEWNLWFGMAQGYAVVGAFAAVFAIWWIARPESDTEATRNAERDTTLNAKRETRNG
jgi:hypothetical protein